MEIKSGKLKVARGEKTTSDNDTTDACIITLNINDICAIIKGEAVIQTVRDGEGHILYQTCVTASKLAITMGE